MGIDIELLKILCCPKCKSKIVPKENENSLCCTNVNCRLIYPVRDGIPVMLVEEAHIDE